jgi:hypothetical protein
MPAFPLLSKEQMRVDPMPLKLIKQLFCANQACGIVEGNNRKVKKLSKSSR